MIVMVALIISIVLQNQSAGLSDIFGGAGVITTRRGSEKWLFYASIVLGVLFAGSTLAIIVLSK